MFHLGGLRQLALTCCPLSQSEGPFHLRTCAPEHLKKVPMGHGTDVACGLSVVSRSYHTLELITLVASISLEVIPLINLETEAAVPAPSISGSLLPLIVLFSSHSLSTSLYGSGLEYTSTLSFFYLT